MKRLRQATKHVAICSIHLGNVALQTNQIKTFFRRKKDPFCPTVNDEVAQDSKEWREFTDFMNLHFTGF
jgi:hypothetical protein